MGVKIGQPTGEFDANLQEIALYPCDYTRMVGVAALDDGDERHGDGSDADGVVVGVQVR